MADIPPPRPSRDECSRGDAGSVGGAARSAGEASAPPAAPDWSTLAEELRCPLCEYNLRGLTEPRCPECGYRFTWAELLDAKRREHLFLFEQPLRRPLYCFTRTLLAGFRPRRLWRSIHPAMPIRPGRLFVYWLIVVLPFLAGVTMFCTEGMSRFDPAWFWYGSRFRELLALLLWPAVLLLTLMIFQISMRRAKIRWLHVMRCVIYSCDVVFWVGSVMLARALWNGWLGGYLGFPTDYLIDRDLLLLLLLCLALFLSTWRLAAAYRHYLRFDHPFATVFCSQVIVVLLYAIFLVSVALMGM